MPRDPECEAATPTQREKGASRVKLPPLLSLGMFPMRKKALESLGKAPLGAGAGFRKLSSGLAALFSSEDIFVHLFN